MFSNIWELKIHLFFFFLFCCNGTSVWYSTNLHWEKCHQHVLRHFLNSEKCKIKFYECHSAFDFWGWECKMLVSFFLLWNQFQRSCTYVFSKKGCNMLYTHVSVMWHGCHSERCYFCSPPLLQSFHQWGRSKSRSLIPIFLWKVWQVKKACVCVWQCSVGMFWSDIDEFLPLNYPSYTVLFFIFLLCQLSEKFVMRCM